MDTRSAPAPPPPLPPIAFRLSLPPPPPIVPRRPNLGNWTDQDHARLRHALERIPSWNIPALAAAVAKPPVEVVWHLSTIHIATLAAHQQAQCAHNPLAAVLMGFNLTGAALAKQQQQQQQQRGDGTNNGDNEQDDDGGWQSMEEEEDPELYAQESDKRTISLEEDASGRAGKKMDRLLLELNLQRPLSRSYMRKVGSFYRNRMVKIMSHHHNADNPLVVLNDTWLDLHSHLVSFIRSRISSAYDAAYDRLQRSCKPGTHIVVDEVTQADMQHALTVCAANSMRNGLARARADRERAQQLAHWWHTEFVPDNPAFRDEQRRIVEKMFRDRGIDLRALRTWRPKEDALARLDHVFVKAKRLPTRRRGAVRGGGLHGESDGDSSQGSSENNNDESDGDAGMGAGRQGGPTLGRVQRLLDVSVVREPVRLPNFQGLFHVDALISVQETDEEEEDDDELDVESDRGRVGLDAEGLPPSGQGSSHHFAPTRRTPRSRPHSPAPLVPLLSSDAHSTPCPSLAGQRASSSPTSFQTPAPSQQRPWAAAHAAAGTPTVSSTMQTPGPRRRPIRYRIGLETEQDAANDEPPSVLKSSRRAKRPLPPDESPSQTRQNRWMDAGAAVTDEGDSAEGGGLNGEDGDSASSSSSATSDGEGSDHETRINASWNSRNVKRARFA